MGTEKTIILSAGAVLDDRRVAVAAITPGELVEIDSAGKIAPHSSDGGNARPIFARENELAGEGIETAIALGDSCPIAYCSSGVLVNAFLDDGTADVDVGDPLMSKGNGNLTLFVPQVVSEGGTATFNIIDSAIVAYADETLTSPAARVRFRVRAV